MGWSNINPFKESSFHSEKEEIKEAQPENSTLSKVLPEEEILDEDSIKRSDFTSDKENLSDDDQRTIPAEDSLQNQAVKVPDDDIVPDLGNEESKDAVPANEDNTEIKDSIAQLLEDVKVIKANLDDMALKEESAEANDNQPDNEIDTSIKNIELNVQQLVQNQGSASDIAVMRRENEAFRSDSNMKLMRAYGIDAMIKTYQGICDQIFKINHSADSVSESADGEKKAYGWVLKRMERQFKRLGIKLQKSEPGEEIDEEYMEVYGSDGSVDVDEKLTMVQTENSDLKNTVKECVCPAFIWTIPSLIGEQKEWVMEPEKICMYK